MILNSPNELTFSLRIGVASKLKISWEMLEQKKRHKNKNRNKCQFSEIPFCPFTLSASPPSSISLLSHKLPASSHYLLKYIFRQSIPSRVWFLGLFSFCMKTRSKNHHKHITDEIDKKIELKFNFDGEKIIQFVNGKWSGRKYASRTIL